MDAMRVLAGTGVFLLLVTVVVSALALGEASHRSEVLKNQSSVAATRHGEIEYAEWGEGPAVLVVHGAGGGFDQGQLLVEAFGGEGFHWISVSRFGYLRSALPDNASTSAQAEAFADLLDDLEIQQVSILAMSGGAPPALQFAKIYPERTERVALLSSAPFTPFTPRVETRPMPSRFYAALFGNDIVYWVLSKIARKQLETAFDARTDLMATSSVEVDFVDELIDGFPPASKRAKGMLNEVSAVSEDAQYDIEAIRAPLLVIHAHDDRINPIAIGESISQRATNSQFISFNRGGHLLLTHHAQVRARLQEFLADDKTD